MKSYFAVVAPGMEVYVARELSRLGITSQIETGGVGFDGNMEMLFAANLHLRIASRLLVRLGDFRAVAFYELVKKAGRLPWEEYLAAGQPVSLHVTCHKSRLYHSDAVALRIASAIGERLGQPAPVIKTGEDSADPAQLVIVRFSNDICTISIDTSGELLHRRGYRLAQAKAPLRETLAAGMIEASGWDGVSPLVDPFCGSGTIPIEAAMLAYRIPPGRHRRFAFMNWPSFERRVWDQMLGMANKAGRLSPQPLILGSDRDEGAVEIVRENAERAGVSRFIQAEHKAISDIELPPGPGWIISNPPYGVRVSENKDLRNLYARLGDVLRERAAGWRFAILFSDPALLRQTRLVVEHSLPLVNGGLPVRLATGSI